MDMQKEARKAQIKLALKRVFVVTTRYEDEFRGCYDSAEAAALDIAAWSKTGNEFDAGNEFDVCEEFIFTQEAMAALAAIDNEVAA